MNKFNAIVEKGCFLVSIIGGTTSMIILIIVIALVKSCFEPYEAPIDRGPKKREDIESTYITDSLRNGFEIEWYTTNAVTKKRAEEIKLRLYGLRARAELQETAADYFKHDFLNTDIYDFVEYAKRFDIDSDVRMLRVFVWGGLCYEYFHPNPGLPGGGCTIFDNDTSQGILYLEESDIYPKDSCALRTYRYFDCDVTSLRDERYTHFTEEERIQ